MQSDSNPVPQALSRPGAREAWLVFVVVADSYAASPVRCSLLSAPPVLLPRQGGPAQSRAVAFPCSRSRRCAVGPWSLWSPGPRPFPHPTLCPHHQGACTDTDSKTPLTVSRVGVCPSIELCSPECSCPCVLPWAAMCRTLEGCFLWLESLNNLCFCITAAC